MTEHTFGATVYGYETMRRVTAKLLRNASPIRIDRLSLNSWSVSVPLDQSDILLRIVHTEVKREPQEQADAATPEQFNT